MLARHDYGQIHSNLRHARQRIAILRRPLRRLPSRLCLPTPRACLWLSHSLPRCHLHCRWNMALFWMPKRSILSFRIDSTPYGRQNTHKKICTLHSLTQRQCVRCRSKCGRFIARFLLRHHMWWMRYYRRAQSSWCGRIHRVVCRYVRKCARRSSHVALATDLPASGLRCNRPRK